MDRPLLDTSTVSHHIASLIRRRSLRRSELDEVPIIFGVLSWLAQCFRRMHYPIDHSEMSGFPAFEYGWKSFNLLYSSSPGKSEKERMRNCIEAHLPDRANFTQLHQDIILEMCNDLTPEPVDKSTTAQQPSNIPHDFNKYITDIQIHYKNQEYNNITEPLLTVLYKIRNHRVHGNYYVAGSQLSLISSKSDYSVGMTPNYQKVPPVLYEMCCSIAMNRFMMDRYFVEGIIKTLVFDYIDEIKVNAREKLSDDSIEKLKIFYP